MMKEEEGDSDALCLLNCGRGNGTEVSWGCW